MYKRQAVHFLEAARFGYVLSDMSLNYDGVATPGVPVVFSDWAWNAIGQSLGQYEEVAITCSHRHNATSASNGPPVDILHMRVPADPSRTLASVQLPYDPSGANSRDAYIFALSLEAIGGRMYGDVDNSGAITTNDALLALMAAAGLLPLDVDAALSADVAPLAADGAFGDGQVQVDDAIAILNKALG